MGREICAGKGNLGDRAEGGRGDAYFYAANKQIGCSCVGVHKNVGKDRIEPKQHGS